MWSTSYCGRTTTHRLCQLQSCHTGSAIWLCSTPNTRSQPFSRSTCSPHASRGKRCAPRSASIDRVDLAKRSCERGIVIIRIARHFASDESGQIHLLVHAVEFYLGHRQRSKRPMILVDLPSTTRQRVFCRGTVSAQHSIMASASAPSTWYSHSSRSAP